MIRIASSHLRRNLVAYLALFVALGGTSYAAAKLPKNSVGSTQIKKNSINSSKVKDKSLKSADFAKGTLLKGDKGDKGDPGPSTGAAGGDLTGTYPAPTIKSGAVDSGKIANGSVTTSDMNVTDATVSVDLAAFAAKQCYDRTIAVPGARVGDIVSAAVPSNFSDQVSVSPLGVYTADVVSVRFCVSPNATVPTTDPGPGDWRFVLAH